MLGLAPSRWLISNAICAALLLGIAPPAKVRAESAEGQIRVRFRGVLAEVIQVRTVPANDAVLPRSLPGVGDLVRVDLRSERG
jgi:hypothetical protein